MKLNAAKLILFFVCAYLLLPVQVIRAQNDSTSMRTGATPVRSLSEHETDSILTAIFGDTTWIKELSQRSDQEYDSIPMTTVEFDEKSHSFGEIGEGAVVNYRYTFKNTGSHPLRIHHVKPSCGCTTPDWTKTDIAPGEKGFVSIQFDSKGKYGIQKKSVTVTFHNTEPHNVVVAFDAEIVGAYGGDELTILKDKSTNTLTFSTVEFEDDTHNFGKIKEGKKVRHTYKFTNTGDAPIRCVSVKPSCGCTTPTWSEEVIAPGKSGFVTVEFDSKGKMGLQKKSVTVGFEGMDPRYRILSFTGEVITKH